MKPFLTNMFWLGCLKHQLEKRIVQNIIGYPSLSPKKNKLRQQKVPYKKNPGMDTIGGWQHLEPAEIVFESLGVGPKLCGQNLRILGNFLRGSHGTRGPRGYGDVFLKYLVVSFIWDFSTVCHQNKWNPIWINFGVKLFQNLSAQLPTQIGSKEMFSSDFLERWLL